MDGSAADSSTAAPKPPSVWRQLACGGRIKRSVKFTLIRLRTEQDLDRRVSEEQRRVHAAMEAGQLELGSDCLEINNAKNLRLRFAMRAAPSIVQVLHEWWETALRSAVEGHTNAIGPADYAICLRAVFKALMDEYEPDEVEIAIEEDWLTDSRGQALLTREVFCDSVFELADLHVDGTWRDQYCDFLWELLDAVTVDQAPSMADMVSMLSSGKAGQPKRVFKQPDNIGRQSTINPVVKPGRPPTLRRQRSEQQRIRLRAVIKIQCMVRAAAARMVVRQRKRAVATIQAGVRGRLARKQVGVRKKAVAYIQRSAHDYFARVKLRLVLPLSTSLKRRMPNIHNARPRYMDYEQRPPGPPPRVRPKQWEAGFVPSGFIVADVMVLLPHRGKPPIPLLQRAAGAMGTASLLRPASVTALDIPGLVPQRHRQPPPLRPAPTLRVRQLHSRHQQLARPWSAPASHQAKAHYRSAPSLHYASAVTTPVWPAVRAPRPGSAAPRMRMAPRRM